jgi:hypothetical protein
MDEVHIRCEKSKREHAVMCNGTKCKQSSILTSFQFIVIPIANRTKDAKVYVYSK